MLPENFSERRIMVGTLMLLSSLIGLVGHVVGTNKTQRRVSAAVRGLVG